MFDGQDGGGAGAFRLLPLRRTGQDILLSDRVVFRLDVRSGIFPVTRVLDIGIIQHIVQEIQTLHIFEFFLKGLEFLGQDAGLDRPSQLEELFRLEGTQVFDQFENITGDLLKHFLQGIDGLLLLHRVEVRLE